MIRVTADKCRWREEGGGEKVAERCLSFLAEVGIEVDWLGNEEAQLLDGLAIVRGRLLIDPDTEVWPSDLLHEGGHIAVAAPDVRPTLGPIAANATDEMMAIAWSYAASRACGVELHHLFHSGGYRDDSSGLATAFASGHYIGAPMLGFHGMTSEGVVAREQGIAGFPDMHRWLR